MDVAGKGQDVLAESQAERLAAIPADLIDEGIELFSGALQDRPTVTTVTNIGGIKFDKHFVRGPVLAVSPGASGVGGFL